MATPVTGAKSLDEDFSMDVALQQYMYNIEQCTTDFTQTPPSLHNLSSITNLQQQTNPAEAGLLDALFPDLEPLASCTAPLSEQEPACTQEPTASTATRHSAAWAAKNRRAQKRFRERQKAQKGEMEQQLSAMADKLKQLKVDNNKITQRNSTLEKVLVFKEGEIAELQDQNTILEVEADDLDAASPLPLSLNQAANPVQADRIIQTYRGIVNLMAGLLLRLDQEGTSDTLLQEMRNATRQSGQLSMQTAVLSPEMMTMLIRVNMEPCHTRLAAMLQDKSSNTPEHWQQVEDLLDLEPDQKRDMLNLHTRFLQKLQDNRNRRRELCVGLQQGSDKVKKLYAVVATEAQKYIASMYEVQSEVGQLKDNLREQHRIWLDFYSTVFHVWDTVQHCHAVVHSFPRYPDILQICTCMMAREQS